MPNALPVRRWHERQLQIETTNGSPSALRRSCPQLQAASLPAIAGSYETRVPVAGRPMGPARLRGRREAAEETAGVQRGRTRRGRDREVRVPVAERRVHLEVDGGQA